MRAAMTQGEAIGAVDDDKHENNSDDGNREAK